MQRKYTQAKLYDQVFLLCLKKKTTHKPSKKAAEKSIFPSLYIIPVTCVDERLFFYVITELYYFRAHSLVASKNQGFRVRVRLLVTSRVEISALNPQLMSKCLWSKWKWYWGVKQMPSPFPYSLVIRQWSWKKVPDRKKINKWRLLVILGYFSSTMLLLFGIKVLWKKYLFYLTYFTLL